MALPALLSGVECGPSNPLQALSKQFERDRGVQQDHFGPPRAGPSRETRVFRTQTASAPGLEQDAAQFFSGRGASSIPFVAHSTSNAFDMSGLGDSLPQKQPLPVGPLGSSAWVGDFLDLQSPKKYSPKPHSESNNFSLNPQDSNRADAQHISQLPPIYFPGMFQPPVQHTARLGDVPRSEIIPHSEAAIHFPPEEIVTQQQPQALEFDPADADELARTAGHLIETVRHETNPKFQKSAFLGFMRQLRDGEMIVQGSDVVKGPTATAGDGVVDLGNLASSESLRINVEHEVRHSSVPSDSTGTAMEEYKGVERGQLPKQPINGRFGREPSATNAISRKSVHFDPFEHGMDNIEDSDDSFWHKENEDFKQYWRMRDGARGESLHTPEWDKLQDDWDRFEATATGIKPVAVYHFQPNNPYLMGEPSTRTHTIHRQRSDWNESVLEKEATVQKNPRDASAWFELGVRQQENEREFKAIQALQRAVELDPSHLAAWLALAISHTNENDKDGAFNTVANWVRNNGRYDGARLVGQLEENGGATAAERHEQLIQCLVGLARTVPEGQIDADIQTALGVLLNTNEEYAKAQDCFRTALAVRPNDWLLYNRVGATLANSGRAEDAVWYYSRALDLNPSYIRARFNLGISCINMKRYRDAAEHILDALSLQENDVFESSDTGGVMSSALWDCLKTTCVQLQREDLTALCDLHNLKGFRKAFLDGTV